MYFNSTAVCSETLLMIHVSSSRSSPKLDTKGFVMDTNQLPFVCKDSCFGSVALVCFLLLLLLRHRTSQFTYKRDSPFGRLSESDWVQFYRKCFFHFISTILHMTGNKTKANRFWYQKLEITLNLSSCKILVI